MKPIKSSKNHISQDSLEHALELAGSEQLFFAQYQGEIIIELLLKHGCRPAHILDYGCGDGTMAYLVSQLLGQAQIDGVDNSQELIEIAQGWYGAQNDRLSFSTKSSKGYKNKYDLIYLANVLHHIPKDKRTAFFKELTDQLAPHGTLIVLEFNPFNLRQVWKFYSDKEERGNHMIMPSSLKKLLSEYGTTITSFHRKQFPQSTKLARLIQYVRPSNIYAVVLKKFTF